MNAMSHAANLAFGSLPDDLARVLSDLDAADAEARRLVASLSEAQLQWQPHNDAGAGWSVAQCLDHLARINAIYIAALRGAVQQSKPGSAPRRGPIQPGWFGRWFIAQMEPPVRRKLKAPKKAVPGPARTGPELLSAFIAAHDQVRALVHDSRELDLNKIRFTNPFISIIHFTVGTGLMVIGAHDRRHLQQANLVCAAMRRQQI
jgi:DinB family protein